MKFSDIPAHDDVKNRLRDMADQNRLPHALLLEGPQGVGKFMLARAFAQYIHCRNRIGGEPCGVCPSCLQHQSLNHIDTFYSFPVIKKASNSSAPAVSDDYIEQWRRMLEKDPFMNFDSWVSELDNPTSKPTIYKDESEALSSKLSFTAHNSSYKIVLMWLPEKMNEQCANKMLKLIEEPFEDSIFILTADNSQEILPTIYSRCQPIRVKPYTADELQQWLIDKHSVEPSMARVIAHNAEGSVSASQSLLKTSKTDKDFLDRFIVLMRLAYQRKVIDLRAWANKNAEYSRETQMRFLQYCSRLLRENFIFNFANPTLNYLNASEADFSSKFARFINERNVAQLIHVFDDAITDIAGNGNSKIIFFDLAVKVILLIKQ